MQDARATATNRTDITARENHMAIGDPAHSGRVQVVLRVLDDAYDKPAWHGPNLRSSARRALAAEAAWRPADHHPNIWELVIHAAYWKYVVRRKLRGEKRGRFPRKRSD